MPNVEIKISTQNVPKTQKDIENELTEKQKQKIATITLLTQQAIANATKIMNYGISNYSNFTGDYTKTEGVQFALGLLGDTAGVAVGISTGPVGATIAIAGLAVTKSLEIVSLVQEQRHKDIESEFLRARSGNTLTNGSRGTEN